MQLHVGRPSGGDGGGGHCLDDATHAKIKEARRLLKEERLRAKKEQKVLRTEIARLRLHDGKLERGGPKRSRCCARARSRAGRRQRSRRCCSRRLRCTVYGGYNEHACVYLQKL